jgi:hypothetical protein
MDAPDAARQLLLSRTRPDPVGAAYARPVQGLPPVPPANPAKLFVVLVTKDGGASGGQAAECTWTYTVEDLDDTTVLLKNSAGDDAVLLTPENVRWHYTAYWYAGQTRTTPNTATSRYGFGWRAANGDLKFWLAGEVAQEGPC